MSHVYLAGARYVRSNEYLPCVKIGITGAGVDTRITQLNSTKMPIVVEELASFHMRGVIDHRTAETLCRHLVGNIANGEWHHLDEPLDEAVARISAALEVMGGLTGPAEIEHDREPHIKRKNSSLKLENIPIPPQSPDMRPTPPVGNNRRADETEEINAREIASVLASDAYKHGRYQSVFSPAGDERGVNAEWIQTRYFADPDTGDVYRRQLTEQEFLHTHLPMRRAEMWNRRWGGRKSGVFVKSKGFVACLRSNLHGQSVSNDRIAFACYHGYLPDAIRHLDGNPFNNAKNNLHEVSAEEAAA